MKPGVGADQVLTQVLARAADGAFAIGPAGSVVLWNRAAERILGWSAREVLGRPCCEVLVGSDVNGNRLCYQGCHVMSLVEQGEAVQHFEMQTRAKTGKSVWLDISILEVPAANGGRSMTSSFVPRRHGDQGLAGSCGEAGGPPRDFQRRRGVRS